LQVLQDELHRLGLKVNHHEENIRFLRSEINTVQESIADLRSKMFCLFVTLACSLFENEVDGYRLADHGTY
jgi:hypothetical protein